jgi:ubiquinone biosynthesis protein COQ4
MRVVDVSDSSHIEATRTDAGQGEIMKALKNRVLAVRAVWSFVDLVRNPDHLDRVFEIADAMSEQRIDVIEKMRDHFARDPRAAAALRDKRRLAIRLDELLALPVGTLGRTYAEHMRANGLDPASIPTLESKSELEFVRAHLYETHDVWHALTGFTTDVAGELGLQAFYAAQAPGGLPLMLLAMGLLNTAIYAMGERERRLEAITRGWQMGKRARTLFGVRWDEHWNRPIDDVRKLLGIDPVVPDLAAAA